MQDVGGSDAVDDLAAALAGQVGGDHLSGDRGGGEALVPQNDRQIAQREQVFRELAYRLGSRPVGAGKRQRQADNEAADAMGVDQAREACHVLAKSAPPDCLERMAMIRRVSDKARPIVFVPTSRPISRAPAGIASRSSKGLLRVTTDDSSLLTVRSGDGEGMALDKATVAHIAALARIRLSEAELNPLADELSQILTWIEQLSEVDTSGRGADDERRGGRIADAGRLGDRRRAP